MSEEQLVPKLRFDGFDKEWKNIKLKDLTKVVVGYVGTISKYYTDKNNGVPLLSTKNITDNGIDLSEINYVTREFHEKNKKSQIFPNDLLIARHGDSGSAFLIPKTLSEAQALNVVIIRMSNKFDSYFIENYFETTKIKRYMVSLKAGSVQGVVNTKDIEKISLNLPSLNEQNKINSFLHLIDEKIELLENKYNYYQDFKKYLMQQIFAQKLRFAEYNEKYDEYLISDLFTSKKGSGLSKDTIENDGTNKCVLYGELYTTYNEIIDNVKSRTNSECNCLSKSGDILIPASTTTKGIDLVTASVILEDNVYLGGDITILRNKDESIVNNSYFAYYFTNGLIKEVSRLTQGSTIIHLYWKDFKKVNVKLPSIEEQEKITNMFVDIDKKLNDINNSIESIQKFKKSLLQQMFV